jgi:hypothetical protein
VQKKPYKTILGEQKYVVPLSVYATQHSHVFVQTSWHHVPNLAATCHIFSPQ